MKVIVGCRDIEKFNLFKEFKNIKNKNFISILRIDLASTESIRRFVEKIFEQEIKVDILINNAGIYETQNKTTLDGFEIHFGVNHLGFCFEFNENMKEFHPKIQHFQNYIGSLEYKIFENNVYIQC